MMRWLSLVLAFGLTAVLAVWSLFWAVTAGPLLGFSKLNAVDLLHKCFLVFLAGEVTALLTLATLVLPSVILVSRFFWFLCLRLFQIKRLIHTLQRKKTVTPDAVLSLAARAGVTKQLVFVEDDDLYAFAYGLLRPQIMVSSGLGNLLSTEELFSVLQHEAYHVRRGRLWRHFFLGVLHDTGRFLPLFKRITDAGHLAEEFAADKYSSQYNADSLVSALLKLARHGTKKVSLPGVGSWLELRIYAICGRRQPTFMTEPRHWLGFVLVLSVLSLPLLGHATNWLNIEWPVGGLPVHGHSGSC